MHNRHSTNKMLVFERSASNFTNHARVVVAGCLSIKDLLSAIQRHNSVEYAAAKKHGRADWLPPKDMAVPTLAAGMFQAFVLI